LPAACSPHRTHPSRREIKPDEDEDAPKEYRALVDKYYRALSEDVEEEKK